MKKIGSLFVAIFFATSMYAAMQIPPRPQDAIGGAAFMDKIAGMSLTEREAAIYDEIASGNIPDAFRKVNHIKKTIKDANDVDCVVEIDVLPDFLAIGSDDDFCRIPMLPVTAQRLATLFGATLPTSKISDLAWEFAEIKLDPWGLTMAADATMTTVPVFKAQNAKIEAQRIPLGKELSAPIAGHKKDIIITNRIATDANGQNSVYIYGWHQLPNGIPIQNIYGGHSINYVDYSHGVRLVSQDMMIDGVPAKVREVLRDVVKYKLLSNETGVMTQTEYAVSGTEPAPAVVKSFAVVPENATSVRILLTPISGVSYTILYGTNVNSLTQSVAYNSSNPVVTGLTADQLYYFGIKAYNANGESPVSKKLAVTPTASTKFALLVEGFNRIVSGNNGTFVSQHAEALKALNKQIASASNDAVIAGLININDYPLVDWILGEESTADKTFDLTEQAKVKSYLEGGGFLYASGSEIGWDIGRPGLGNPAVQFMSDYLKCTYVADNPGTAKAQSHKAIILSDTGFGDDNFTFSFADGSTTTVEYPDVLAPTGGSVGFLRYTLDAGGNTNVNYAGTAYAGKFGSSPAQGVVVVMGIPFESIVPAAARRELMSRIINYAGVLTTGISDLTASDKVYTTPLGVRVELENFSEIIIYNITGTVIHKVKANGIFEYPLARGVYLVKVNNVVTKIVKF